MTNSGFHLLNRISQICSAPIHWLVLGGALLVTVISIGTTLAIQNFRQHTLYHEERELKTVARLLADNLDRNLQYLEVVQKDLIEHMRSIGITTVDEYKTKLSNQDTYQMLRSKMETLPYIGGLDIFDADGNLINSPKAWPAPKVNIADRDYFRIFKSEPGSPDVLLMPIDGRVSGSWSTIIARRISGPNGEFLGVVTRSIAPAYFERSFASVEFGPGRAIAMFRRDGTLLARYPHVDRLIGRNFGTGNASIQSVLERDRYSGRKASPFDGDDSLVASDALENFPVVVVATSTISTALADWRETIGMLIAVAAFSALSITTFLIAVVFRLQKQHRTSQERLTLEKQRLDRAVNSMAQGLALFDSSGRLVICNQRYVEMYGFSAEVVRPGCSFREIIQHRKAVGSIACDVDERIARIWRDRHARSSTILNVSDGRSIQVIREPLADGGWLATHEDITERRRVEDRITHLAHYDELTNLPNRILFQERLRQELALMADGEQLAVHFVDVDEFKGVNDTLGHLIGDELLKSIAASLSRCVAEHEFVARLGGDEFAIVQSKVTSTGCVTNLVTKVFDAIREPFDCMGHQILADASIGIVLVPQHGTTPDQILKRADLAMYAAKSAGRHTYRFFEPDMDAKVQERRQIEIDLRQAIVRGELEVHYQPCLSLRDDIITGCEALVRWRHPKRGMVSPAEFIPIAEETGLINEIGEWVLRTACKDAASWPSNIRVAVNISPVQIRNKTLPLRVMAALSVFSLPASRLELEITEAVLIRDDEAALAILHQLREVGIRIALDDFGTGYSSLSYLQRFPFDKIKIDRSFVNDIASPDGSSSIVQAVVDIAAARRMTTTAEGVETEEQRRLLRALGCTEMQGYLFSSAQSSDRIMDLFARHRARLAEGDGAGLASAGGLPALPGRQ